MVRNGLVSNRGKSKGRKEALAYSTNEEEEDDDNVEKGQFNAAPHPFSSILYTLKFIGLSLCHGLIFRDCSNNPLPPQSLLGYVISTSRVGGSSS